MASLPEFLKPSTPAHNKIVSWIREIFAFSEKQMQTQHGKWNDAERQLGAYIDESETDDKQGGKKKWPFETKLYIPYTLAIHQTLLAYLHQVLASRQPPFPLQGRGPEDIRPARAMESVLSYQAHRQGAVLPIFSILNSALTYSLGWICNTWDEEWKYQKRTLRLPIEVLGQPFGYKVEEMDGWVQHYEGNYFEAVDPYSIFPDPRVSMVNFQDGDFIIRRLEVSYRKLLDEQTLGTYVNVETLEAIDKKGSKEAVPQGGASSLAEGMPTSDKSDRSEVYGYNKQPQRKFSASELDKGFHEILEVQAWIIPKDLGIGGSTQPQLWMFTLADNSILLRGARMDYQHQKFTYANIAYQYDPFSVFTQSLPDILGPMTSLVNWLMSSHIENVKMALNGLLLINPMLIDEDGLNADDPLRWVHLSPDAWDDPGAMDRALKHFPIPDMTRGHIQDVNVMLPLIRQIVAASDAMMGTHPASKRTATEFAATSAGPVNRMKMIAEIMHTQGFIPWIEMMVLNTQQYLSSTKYYRILGRQASSLTPEQQQLLVGPTDVQGLFDIAAVDGSLPLDKVEAAQTWIQLLGIMGSRPEVFAEYDLGAIIREIAMALGRRDIDDFRRAPTEMLTPRVEVVPDEEAERRAGRGEIIPLSEVRSLPERTPGAGGVPGVAGLMQFAGR